MLTKDTPPNSTSAKCTPPLGTRQQRVTLCINGGDGYMLLSTLLWSWFPIISILAFQNLSPIFTAGVSSLIGGLFFLAILTFRKQLSLFKTIPAWKEILLSTAINGIGFYALLFYGMSLTSAGNTAIFSQFEVLTSFLILSFVLKQEPFVKRHAFAAILMVGGASVILFPQSGEFGVKLGDLIIIAATFLPPFGNLYAKKALRTTSPIFLLTIRNLISGPALLAMSLLWGEALPQSNLLLEAAPFLLINGFLMLGLSKILFMEAIKRITISKCISLSMATPALTLLFAYLALGEIPTAEQIAGLIPMLAGGFLLLKSDTKNDKKLK